MKEAVLVSVVVAVVAVTAGVSAGCGCWGEDQVYLQDQAPITGWYSRSSTTPHSYQRRINLAGGKQIIYLLRYNPRGFWYLSENLYNSTGTYLLDVIKSSRRAPKINILCPGRCACRRVSVSVNKPVCWVITGTYTRKEVEEPHHTITTSTLHQNIITPQKPTHNNIITPKIPHYISNNLLPDTPTPKKTPPSVTSTIHHNTPTSQKPPHQDTPTPKKTSHQDTPTPQTSSHQDTPTPQTSSHQDTLTPRKSPHQDTSTPEPQQASNTSKTRTRHEALPMGPLQQSKCLLNRIAKCLIRENNEETLNTEEVQDACHKYTTVLSPSSWHPPQTQYSMPMVGRGKNYTLTQTDDGDFWWIVVEDLVYAVSNQGGPCPDQLPQNTTWQLVSHKQDVDSLQGDPLKISGEHLDVTCSDPDPGTQH